MFSEGPARRVRALEGPASGVRGIMLDDPSRFGGRDKHAPPRGHDKRASPTGGPDKQVPPRSGQGKRVPPRDSGDQRHQTCTRQDCLLAGRVGRARCENGFHL